MVMHDNELEKKERKFKPRIKLNHIIYIWPWFLERGRLSLTQD